MIELSWLQLFGVIAGSFMIGVFIGCAALALVACRSIACGCHELERD
jgi:hypothetical protein